MMTVFNGKVNKLHFAPVGGEKPIVGKCFHFLIFKPFPPCTYYLVFSVIRGNGQRTERAKSTTAAVPPPGSGHCAPAVILATFDCDPVQFCPIWLCRNNSLGKVRRK